MWPFDEGDWAGPGSIIQQAASGVLNYGTGGFASAMAPSWFDYWDQGPGTVSDAYGSSAGGYSSVPAISSGRRPRLIPYTPGMAWPGPGYGRPVLLPARRGTAARPAGLYLRRSRRMNPLNIHALRRADHRIHAATHLVRRLLSLPKHGVKFKKGGRRRKR